MPSTFPVHTVTPRRRPAGRVPPKEVKIMNKATMLWLGIMAVIGAVMIFFKLKSKSRDEA
jgi:hypothetical protein